MNNVGFILTTKMEEKAEILKLIAVCIVAIQQQCDQENADWEPQK